MYHPSRCSPAVSNSIELHSIRSTSMSPPIRMFEGESVKTKVVITNVAITGVRVSVKNIVFSFSRPKNHKVTGISRAIIPRIICHIKVKTPRL